MNQAALSVLPGAGTAPPDAAAVREGAERWVARFEGETARWAPDNANNDVDVDGQGKGKGKGKEAPAFANQERAEFPARQVHIA